MYYVYGPEGIFNTTWVCRFCESRPLYRRNAYQSALKSQLGSIDGWNQIRSRGIHRAPLARQGEGALSPLFVVIGSVNRTRTHQKIYFLRRWLVAGEETGDEDDGTADGREREGADAANLLFLRNSQ